MKTTKRIISESATSKYFKKQKKTSKSSPNEEVLAQNFYEKDCIQAAKSLLGQTLVRSWDNEIIRCRIVEVESYLGREDKASHSFNGEQTPRNKAMFMEPGTLYVYMTYGMYYCMNISVGGAGDAVLIRAVEPIEGEKTMKENRILHRKTKKDIKDKDICNGPSKLCQAMRIDRDMDQLDLTKGEGMWLEGGERISDDRIVCCERIGLGPKAAEWLHKPLRFYVCGNSFVSQRNKIAEAEIATTKVSS